VTRKLLAVGATLILATGLIFGSVSAGPGAQSTAPSKSTDVFRPMSQQSLPFTVSQNQVAKPNKVTLAPHHTVQRVRAGKLAPTLSDQMNTAPANQQFDVVVTTNDDPSELVASLGAEVVKQTFKSALFGFAARLTTEQLHDLASMDTVSTIDMDEVVQALDDGSETWTGVKKVKEDFHLSGDRDGWRRSYSARDVVIAIIDTGIDTTHKDLAGKVIGWHDMINDTDTPYDDHGHGTHVSSIAAGAGIANPTLQGVAPGAALVGVKVLDGNGSGTFATVIGGIDWAVENKEMNFGNPLFVL
jgi:serine protease AprX